MDTMATTGALDSLDRRLLDEFQHGFPLSPRPFAEIARRLRTDEATVIERLRALVECGAVSRIGAVVAPHSIGWSTLAAMAVPPGRMDEVAALVGGFAEVNHNYEREHRLNLWFVVTGRDEDHVGGVLDEIGRRTGIAVIDLPMLEPYRLSLGFPLRWT